MPKLIKDQKLEDELEELKGDLPKLYAKVKEDLKFLAYYGYRSIVEPDKPPHTETYEEGIKYVKTRQSKNHYRVYFFLTGDYVVCLKGWLKKQNDISKSVKKNIHKRHAFWQNYLRSG